MSVDPKLMELANEAFARALERLGNVESPEQLGYVVNDLRLAAKLIDRARRPTIEKFMKSRKNS